MRLPSHTHGVGLDAPNSLHAWLREDAVQLSLIIVVAAIARFVGIGSASLWLDEAASWWYSTQPLSDLWGIIPLYEPHPPFFYTLLKGWSALFGTSEAALRSLSAVTSLLCVPAVYLIGRMLIDGSAGRWIGLTAALLLGIHPLQVSYAQEARPYASQTLCFAALLAALTWLAKQNVLALPPRVIFKNKHAVYAIIILVLATAAALWMHQTAILLVGVALAAALLVIVLRDRSAITLLNATLMGLAVLILWARNVPWLLVGFHQVQQGFWIPRPDALGLLNFSDTLFGSLGVAQMPFAKLIALSVMFALAAMGALALTRAGRGWAALMLGLATLLPVLISFGVSLITTPIFIPRTVLWVEVPFVVLVAASVLWVRHIATRVGAVLLVTIVAAIVVSLRLTAIPKEDWREVARVLITEGTPADTIVVGSPHAEVPLLYYGVPQKSRAKWLALPRDFPGEADSTGIPTGLRVLTAVDAGVLQRISTLARNSRNVWYTIRTPTIYDSNNAIPNTIAAARPKVRVRVHSNDLDLLTKYSP